MSAQSVLPVPATGMEVVDNIASRASMPLTKPPISAQREVSGCPEPGTGPCPYAYDSVLVPWSTHAWVASLCSTDPSLAKIRVS